MSELDKENNMSEQLETKNVYFKYVIEVDKDGVRKYISKSFPRIYQHTIKLNKARMFDTREIAEIFIEECEPIVNCPILNPVIKRVSRTFKVEE